MTVDRIVTEIKKKPSNRKPILIAIEGYGGAGKSTIAQQLKQSLGNAYIISVDEFIIKELLREKSSDSVLFDRNRLERQVLIPIQNGKPVTYQRLEWAENRLSDPIAIPQVDFLIVEGISATHPDIEKYFDYTIWVNTPIEVAKQRGKLRDTGNENESNWDIWAENDLAYQAKHHPELKATYIIDNTQDKQ